MTEVRELAPPLRCAARRYHAPRPARLVWHHVHPTGLNGPNTAGNRVGLCDNDHYAVHALLDLYLAADARPPWRVRRRFGRGVQRLAAEGYRRIVMARAIPQFHERDASPSSP